MAGASKTILVVDDEASQRELLSGFLTRLGFQPRETETAEQALDAIRQQRPDMVLLDVRLPGMNGIEALREIRDIDSQLPVLLITAHADLRQAVAAVKSGADDYMAKPVDLQELRTAILDALGGSHDDSSRGNVALPELPEGFVCVSRVLCDLLQTVAVVAPSAAPVLITGESGTGKERIAELIHRWSPRAARPLVTANCGGLPETLIESELFGHTKGAFTGASQARDGVFRAADGGTLLLDEIGELPLHLQPKLLRVLEAGEIRAVGSDQCATVDVRLIAATHTNLEQAIQEGRFREDLYYRINVIELRVPALRERRDDILPLARAFATSFTGGPVRLSPQATQCLLNYSWPGNVRELRNALQCACLLCRGDVIMPEHLPPKIAALTAGAPEADIDEERLAQVERATILATLHECQGNRTQAAKKLGISRRALLYKLRAIESS